MVCRLQKASHNCRKNYIKLKTKELQIKINKQNYIFDLPKKTEVFDKHHKKN
mgnify:CR=1 FL=1